MVELAKSYEMEIILKYICKYSNNKNVSALLSLKLLSLLKANTNLY